MKTEHITCLILKKFLLILFILIPILLNAQTMNEAMEQAVEGLVKNGLSNQQKMKLVVEVTNYDSNKKDIEARKIESNLFTALQTQFPRAELLLSGESLTGVSLKAVVIQAKYQLRGEKTTVNVKALDRMSGKVISEMNVLYISQQKVKKNLVAVLDIEAETLTTPQRKIYSKLFRTALINTDQFDLISSDAIDRADADKIQEEFQCSREECATIIAQQLAANQVITTIYGKVTDKLYFLTGSLKDISSGETLAEEKVKHNGDINTLEVVMEQLACKLAQTCDSSGEVQFSNQISDSNIKSGFKRITPTQSGNTKSPTASLFLESNPLKAEIFLNDSFGETALGKTPYQNFSFKAGQMIRITLRKENHHDKKLELRLKGGMNDLGTINLLPAYGSVNITTEPEGVNIYIAGQKKGKTPYFAVEVESGAYLYSLRKNLFDPIENQRLIVEDGKNTTIHKVLAKNFGQIRLETEPTEVTAQVFELKTKVVIEEITTSDRPVNFKLSPGSYILKLSKANYDSLEFEISIAKNKTQTIGKKNTTLRRQEGYLVVSTQPFQRGAEVFINGVKQAVVPANLTLLTGEYEVEVKYDGKVGKEKITIKDGSTQNLILELKEQSSDMVLIPAGNFKMGSNKSSDEKPIHSVYLDEYYIDQYEVTVADYRKCVSSGSCDKPRTGKYYNWGTSGRDQHPVNGVNWSSAKKFCSSIGKRLPTEAEWEKAATWKNGRKHKYPSGKSSVSCQDAVMKESGKWNENGGCGRVSTWNVGSKSPEINGTYDMAGNVWEWVADWYDKSYYSNSIGSRSNPEGPSSGSRRVIRGGGWDSGASYLRGASRGSGVPSRRRGSIGFRCVQGDIVTSESGESQVIDLTIIDSNTGLNDLTIIDSNTGLNDLTIIDSNTGLEWQKGETEKMEWNDAMNYCNNLSLANKYDWRLPKKEELATSYKIKNRFPNVNSWYYWSSTSASYTGHAWRVFFDDGYVLSSSKIYDSCVRCVRGGQ
jgi:formylglycine-generating enzyme required for sulfatase activity